MFLNKTGAVANKRVAAIALPLWLVSSGAARAEQPHDWQMNLQPPATPVMHDIEAFHTELLWIITAVCIFVLLLLIWVMVRYNARANPVPSRITHNTLIEVIWTAVPVLILLAIAIPSFRLLYFEMVIPRPDVTIRAIGKQWYWTYMYPDRKITFDSLMLSDEDAAARGEPRLLGVDNPLVVPVGKVIEVDTIGADVIHSWALPAFGVKMDAIPGRINRTWFKAERTGTFYGECSELCGARHAFMPIEVKVVTEAQFNAWLITAAKQFSSRQVTGTTRLAALKQ